MPLVYDWNLGDKTKDYADAWNGSSPDPKDRATVHQNHESAMDQAEVLRLAKGGIALLTDRVNAATIRAGNDKGLKAALGAATVRDQTVHVRIDKGIHQRYRKPHITARIGSETLHIWLSAVLQPVVSERAFTWKALAVSATEGGTKVPNKPLQGVRARNGSISYQVLEKKQQQIKAAAEAEAARDAALEAVHTLFE